LPISVKHSKVSEKTRGKDDSLIQPTDWNAVHVFDVNTQSLVGNPTGSVAAATNIPLSSEFKFEGGKLSLTTSLNDVDIVVATIDAANPDSARVLTNTPTVSWDTATAKQVKATVVDDSISLAKMAHGAAGGEILYYSKTSTPVGAPTHLAAGDPGTVLTNVSGATVNPSWGYSGAPHCVLIDEKPNGAANVAFATGAWRDRVINTQVLDTFHLVTFASNIFTLGIGTWVIEWSCPAQACGAHQTRLYNSTATAHPVVYGTSEYAPDTGNLQTRSTGVAQVTHTVATGYKIQHYCIENGFFGRSANIPAVGIPAGDPPEIFTIVKIWRVA
jgi:hypothetical protein